MKRTFTILLLLVGSLSSTAQVPAYTSTLAPTGGNSFPFNSASSNKLQGIYTPADFPVLPPSGYISSVFFQVGTTFTATTQVRTSPDVRIALGYVGISDFGSTSTFFTGLDTVYYAATRVYTALVTGDWVEFMLQSPFYYDNTLNLLVQGSCANTATNQGFTIRNATVPSKRLYAGYTATTGTVGAQLGQFGLNIIPLAVNLTNFEGSYKNGAPLLRWTTASEQDASHFEIERSIDGRAYATVGKVNAKGVASDYFYADHEVPTSGNLYYRMRMVDIEGSVTMSKTVKIKPSATSSATFVLYPNPTEGTVTITLPMEPKGVVEVLLADETGKLLLSKAYATSNSTVYFHDMRSLPAGVYTITVLAEGITHIGKVVKR